MSLIFLASLLGYTWGLFTLVRGSGSSTSIEVGTVDANARTVKGVEELVNEFKVEGNPAGYLACLIAILYFGTVYSLEKMGSSTIWKGGVREILADYAYVVSLAH